MPQAARRGPSPGTGVGVLDLVEALPRVADAVVVPAIGETHLAVARRVYGVAGVAFPRAAAARHLHEGVANSVFGAIRLGLRGCSGAVRGARAGLGGWADPRLDGRGTDAALTMLNAIAGDHLSVDAPALAVGMTVREGGKNVNVDADAVRAAFPHAGARIVVFLHGLGDNEHRWTEPRVSPCVDAVREMGWTPVLIRLNTGLSLGENGARLAQLLSDLVRAWPVPPQRIALVGHSMGGLIARSAAHAGRDLAPGWVDLLTDVVMVGTPHLGADLARVAAGGRCALAVLPETSPWGRVVDRRSAGIKDLAVGLPGLRPLPGVRYRLVSGQLDRPWGLLLGDLYVRRSSATGRRRRANLFPGADHLHLDSTSHLGLLRHPHLPQQLESWLR